MVNTLSAADAYYDKARLAGLKEGGSPSILKKVLASDGIKAASEFPLGLMQIPIEQIAGTYDEGRENCFSTHFYPVMGKKTEFASKWIALCKAHLDEGISNPVEAYEYMGQYYIVEGNKRVSVLSFFDSVSVYAEVTRILPPLGPSKKVRINYEFIDFYNLTGISFIYFNERGCFFKLLRLTTKEPGYVWNDDDRKNFTYLYNLFRTELEKQTGPLSYIKASTAFLAFVSVFEYKTLLDASVPELREMITKDISEIRTAISDNPLNLQADPTETRADPKVKLLHTIFSNNPSSLKVGFIYSGTISNSGWTYSHEIARRQLESSFSGKVETRYWDNITASNISETLEEAIESGCDLIFTTSSIFLKGSIRAAIDHPKVKILNCSLNKPQKAVRIYSARMYEVKFLMGIIAASLADNHRIGYIADYPIYGATAGINAFALGAQMIDPSVKIYLNWSKIEGVDMEAFLWNNQLAVVCGKDSGIGLNDNRFGLFKISDGNVFNAAMPIWNWAVFYEKIVRSILNGTWKEDEAKDPVQGISYWWGMSSCIASLVYSRDLPAGTLRLLGNMRQALLAGAISPFRGPLVSQDRTVQTSIHDVLDLPDIMTMNWLAENVIGEIPPASALTPQAKIMAEFQSVRTEENLL